VKKVGYVIKSALYMQPGAAATLGITVSARGYRRLGYILRRQNYIHLSL